MNVAWTVDLGQLVILGLMLTGGVGTFYALREIVKSIAVRMDKVEEELGKQTDILIGLARQEEKIMALQYRVSNLEHVHAH